VIVSTLSSKFNKAVAPFLLRNGLSARFILGWGVIRDNPILDSLLLLPFAQHIISIEVQDDAIALAKKRADENNIKKEKSSLDRFVDKVWDRYFEPVYPEKNYMEDGNVKADALNCNNNPRLQILESRLRPILAPNNEWWDVTRWQFNHRFQKWVRGEYLLAKYGSDVKEALRLYPSLKKIAPLQQLERRRRDSILGSIFFDGVDSGIGSDKTTARMVRERERDNTLNIPSSKSLIKALSMENWNRTKIPSAEYQSMEEITRRLGGTVKTIPGTNIPVPDIVDDTDISSLSLEELLEVTGCHVANCGAFNALCEEGNIYEFWTKEYVDKLASYLLDRSEDYGEGDTVVVDVGAGDGTLAFFLRQSLVLEKKNRTKGGHRIKPQRGRRIKSSEHVKNEIVLPTVVATDDGSWRIKSQANIEGLNVVDSMKKYGKWKKNRKNPKQQIIVICSWMPMGEDWTQTIRDGGADEYILIGECDDGNCGHNWLTWGNMDFDVREAEDELEQTLKLPPYVDDGFERCDMEYLSKMQFSRFDSSVSSASKTVCFRKT